LPLFSSTCKAKIWDLLPLPSPLPCILHNPAIVAACVAIVHAKLSQCGGMARQFGPVLALYHIYTVNNINYLHVTTLDSVLGMRCAMVQGMGENKETEGNMRTDANGKVWATWREWMKMGRNDARKGIEPRYPKQLDYMVGYESEKRNHAYLN